MERSRWREIQGERVYVRQLARKSELERKMEGERQWDKEDKRNGIPLFLPELLCV